MARRSGCATSLTSGPATTRLGRAPRRRRRRSRWTTGEHCRKSSGASSPAPTGSTPIRRRPRCRRRTSVPSSPSRPPTPTPSRSLRMMSCCCPVTRSPSTWATSPATGTRSRPCATASTRLSCWGARWSFTAPRARIRWCCRTTPARSTWRPGRRRFPSASMRINAIRGRLPRPITPRRPPRRGSPGRTSGHARTPCPSAPPSTMSGTGIPAPPAAARRASSTPGWPSPSASGSIPMATARPTSR